MELILTEDVENLGEVGETVEVADGYGRNYLLPKNLAVRPTKGNRMRYQKVRRKISKRREERREWARETAEKLQGLLLEIERRTAEAEGHLYGSVRREDIISLVEEESGIELSPDQVELERPIEEVGGYDIEIGLYEDISATITVKVMPEGEGEGEGIEEEVAESEAEDS